MPRSAIPAPRTPISVTGATILAQVVGTYGTTSVLDRAPQVPPATQTESFRFGDKIEVVSSGGGGAVQETIKFTDTISVSMTLPTNNMFANILYPLQTSAKMPVAIVIHGGGLYGGGRNDLSGVADMQWDMALEGYVAFNIDYLLTGTPFTSTITATSSGTVITDTVPPLPPSQVPGWNLWNSRTLDHQLILSGTSTNVTVQNAMDSVNGDNYQLLGGGTVHIRQVVQSIYDVIAWVIATAPSVGGDPNNITIIGGSSGGHLAALCWLTDCGGICRPRAVACMSGSMYMHDPANLAIAIGGQGFSKNAMATFNPWEDYNTWNTYSPVFLMDSIDVAGKGPLWLGAGAGEGFTGTSVLNSRGFRDKLIARGVTPGYFEWSTADHSWDGRKQSNTLLGQLLPWLRTTQLSRRIPTLNRVAIPAPRTAVP